MYSSAFFINFFLSLVYSSAKSALSGCSGSGSFISATKACKTEKKGKNRNYECHKHIFHYNLKAFVILLYSDPRKPNDRTSVGVFYYLLSEFQNNLTKERNNYILHLANLFYINNRTRCQRTHSTLAIGPAVKLNSNTMMIDLS